MTCNEVRKGFRALLTKDLTNVPLCPCQLIKEVWKSDDETCEDGNESLAGEMYDTKLRSSYHTLLSHQQLIWMSLRSSHCPCSSVASIEHDQT